MKKILLAEKGANDMTSFLRAWGAFTHPSMRGVAMPVRPPEDLRWVQDWTYYLENDVIYLHRPHTGADYHIIERAKLLGIPLWIDLDDDLQSITADNPSYSLFNNDSAKACMIHAIREADILSVGGACHAERLRREYNREVLLIPNALDDRLLSLRKPFKFSDKIAWRGSESHRTDLLFYAKELANALDGRNPTFFGLNPYWFDWYYLKYNWVEKTQDMFQFYVALTSFNATFHLVPMVNTEFNRVKSNLCYSDAALAGSVTFAPEYLPEYDRPGVFRYKKDSFEKDLETFLDLGAWELQTMHKEAWDWITDNILMSKVNRQRIEVLENV